MKNPFRWYHLLIILVLAVLVVYAFDVGGLKDDIAGGVVSLGVFLGNVSASITATPFWASYGGIVLSVTAFTAGLCMAILYYKGKFSIMRWGTRTAAQETGFQAGPTYQPQPIPVPTSGEPTTTTEPTPLKEEQA